jgi:hypothetical protein
MTSNKGNNASSTKQWRCLRIDDSNNAIVTRATNAIATTAKTPAHQQQQHHHNKGNNASLTTSNKGNNASLIRAEMPLHQRRQ